MNEDLDELLEQLDSTTRGLVDFMETGYDNLLYPKKDDLFFRVFTAKRKLEKVSAEITRRLEDEE